MESGTLSVFTRESLEGDKDTVAEQPQTSLTSSLQISQEDMNRSHTKGHSSRELGTDWRQTHAWITCWLLASPSL